MVRILIADDHAIVREGVRNLIETHTGWSVCGEAGDGLTALSMAATLAPDLAIVDLALPAMSGLVLTRRFRETWPGLKVLLFTFLDDEQTVASGLAAGADGYVLKSEESGVLARAIETIMGGGAYVSPSILAKTRNILQGATDWVENFTPRELEVVSLVAGGRSNKQIAHLLHISAKTVEVHRASAMKRAEVRSIADLVRFAIRHHLIET